MYDLTPVEPKIKKAPYAGDPTNPFTMCSEKHRRHSMRDIGTFEWTSPEGETKKMALCRHCREFAVKTKEENDAHPGS